MKIKLTQESNIDIVFGKKVKNIFLNTNDKFIFRDGPEGDTMIELGIGDKLTLLSDNDMCDVFAMYNYDLNFKRVGE